MLKWSSLVPGMTDHDAKDFKKVQEFGKGEDLYVFTKDNKQNPSRLLSLDPVRKRGIFD